MKEEFREYHRFAESGYKDLLARGLFVFDTNTLLNMYRYNRETADDFISTLEKLRQRDQVWIPYQVGFEFHESRHDLIMDYKSSYDKITNLIDDISPSIEKIYVRHPFLSMAGIAMKIAKSLEPIKKDIEKAKKEHPDWMRKDDILTKIDEIFEGAIGRRYTKIELETICKEGEERYSKKIPPGYKDIDKSDDKKYGDLIIWYQIIEKAKEAKRPIVFVSGDVKEDWWLIKKGERVMPNPALKREMLDEADVDFHIYTADKFIEHFQPDTTRPTKENTIKEVKEVRELEESKSKREDRISPNIYMDHIDQVNYSRYNPRSSELYQLLNELLRRLSNLHSEIESLPVASSSSSRLDQLLSGLDFQKSILVHRGANYVDIQDLIQIAEDYSLLVFTTLKNSDKIDFRKSSILSYNDEKIKSLIIMLRRYERNNL